MTAATTRIVGGSIMRLTKCGLFRSEIDPEQLLTHQQDIAGVEPTLAPQSMEGAVRTTHVRKIDSAVTARCDAAVKPRDVPILGEEHVATLPTAMDPPVGNRK